MAVRYAPFQEYGDETSESRKTLAWELQLLSCETTEPIVDVQAEMGLLSQPSIQCRNPPSLTNSVYICPLKAFGGGGGVKDGVKMADYYSSHETMKGYTLFVSYR